MVLSPELENLFTLHAHEETLRQKAYEFVEHDSQLESHLVVIEAAMDLAFFLHTYPTEDEDMKVIQILGMRIFNAFGASLKLALSGYGQNSALIIRDILETAFLLDLFQTDAAKISCWRQAGDKERRKQFSPAKVRKALDTRDGFKEKKREEHYRRFSELAAHPTMKSDYMMRPNKDGDAVIGPFIVEGLFEAVLSEMGQLAFLVGHFLDHFFAETWVDALATREKFARAQQRWRNTFHLRE